MPYHSELGAGSCAADQWAVLDADGQTVGCHDSQLMAQDQITTLTATEPTEVASGRMMAGRALTPAPAPDTGRSSQTVRTTSAAPAGRVSHAPRQA